MPIQAEKIIYVALFLMQLFFLGGGLIYILLDNNKSHKRRDSKIRESLSISVHTAWERYRAAMCYHLLIPRGWQPLRCNHPPERHPHDERRAGGGDGSQAALCHLLWTNAQETKGRTAVGRVPWVHEELPGEK